MEMDLPERRASGMVVEGHEEEDDEEGEETELRQQ
jgi:hypothetical protein